MLGIKLFIPSETFDNMYKMFYAYDCTTHIIYNKAKRPRKQKKDRKPKTYYIWMEKLESAEKIFAPWRFDGTNYLVWQNFARNIVPSTRKWELKYDGYVTVCITVETQLQWFMI